MTSHTVLMTLHVPRAVLTQAGTLERVKALLLEQHLWPTNATLRRWAIDAITQDYVIDLETQIQADPQP